MTSPEQKPSPPDILTPGALIKANLLGIGLLTAFLVSAGLLYILMGFIGWEAGAGRVLAALVLSPLIVGTFFGIWWLSIQATTDDTTTSDTPKDKE